MLRLQALIGAAPAASLLLATIVAVGVLGLFVVPALIERSVFRPYWLVSEGEYATLVAHAFVHADVAHLLFNAFTFWAFAFALEAQIGSAAFAALYATGLAAAAAGTWVRHRADPDYRTLGASGAILAVLFASIVHFPRQSIFILPIPVPIPAPLFAVGYLAFTAYASRSRRVRINHDAHLWGAIAGVAFVAITDPAALRRALHLITG